MRAPTRRENELMIEEDVGFESVAIKEGVG